MKAKELMTDNPACCTPDVSLQDAARLMAENDCGFIPVVQDLQSKRLIGVLTDRDICCRAVSQGKDPKQVRVMDCMTSKVITAGPDTDVEECCKRMERDQIRRLPVVDRAGNCCGVLTQGDLAARLDEREVGEVVREVSRPIEERPHMGA